MSKNIVIGNKIKEGKFIGGDKYYFLDGVFKEGEFFTKGTRVIFNDPDDGEEFIGEIEWIIILENNNIEASIKDIAYGRVDFDLLELY